MQLALIADAFPPMKTSGAVQIRDLVSELCLQGHHVTVLLPDSTLQTNWTLEEKGNLAILRLRAMQTKNVSYARRALAEFLLSYLMYRNLEKSPLRQKRWEGIIWYSPTIFLGSLVKKIKDISHCRAYLILRDIFPDWAVDMELLNRGLVYRYFKSIEKFQYQQADTIGIQTPSNKTYFLKSHPHLKANIEVLNNWLSHPERQRSSIQLVETPLAGRKIFAYTGNIGIAQGMDILMELAHAYKSDPTVGFIFVGRGTAVMQLRQQKNDMALENVLIYDEIEPNEIPDLLGQCHAGLIALDPRHQNDNIPGKFLAYMQAGLPVLATINVGNDLEAIINEHHVGEVITSHSVTELKLKADKLLAASGRDEALKARCHCLSENSFSSSSAVKQIIAALNR